MATQNHPPVANHVCGQHEPNLANYSYRQGRGMLKFADALMEVHVCATLAFPVDLGGPDFGPTEEGRMPSVTATALNIYPHRTIIAHFTPQEVEHSMMKKDTR